MENAGTTLSEQCSLLLGRLPEITRVPELVTLSASLLDASLYIVDGHGKILAHSAKENVVCSSWLSAVEKGHLHPEHLKATLAPTASCNVIRDTRCTGRTCTRLSIPVNMGEGLLPGAVLFFFWDHEATYEMQCLASILAGAFSSLLQKQRREETELGDSRAHLLRELMDYKPGLRNYYLAAIKSEGLADLKEHFHLCVMEADEPKEGDAEELLPLLRQLLPEAWGFAWGSGIVCVHNTELLAEKDFARSLYPILEEHRLHACYSIGFDDLPDLRYVCESTFLALSFSAEERPGERFQKADHYMFRTVLSKISRRFPQEEIFPDSFLKLVEYDRENNRSYMQTLSAYLDNGRNANAAAKQIFLHRNTVMQQLERIEQILGVSLEDNEICLFLQFCIRLYALQERK